MTDVMELTVANARARLATWTEAAQTPEADRLDVVVTVGNLLAAVAALEGWGYLSAITGLDQGVEAGQLEVLYHFCSGAVTLTLRVSIARATPSIPSICRLIPPAVVFERELLEMFGVTVIGIPNADPLFLSDDWARDIYPLRKDAALE